MGARTELEVDGRVERGRIVLDAPSALPEGARLHLRITVQPAADDRGWPAGFFEQTAGQIIDPDFKRPPQGEYEVREPLT